MNNRKALIVILILIITCNFLVAEINNINLSKPIKIKLRNCEKFKSHVLCFTEKGFVLWDKPELVIEDIPKSASYHSFEELEYFQLKGKKNFIPFAIAGGAIFVIARSGSSSDPERAGIESFYGNIFAGILTGLVFLIYLAIPANSKLDSAEEIEEFPSQHVTFPDEIPLELQDFIELHEE